MSFQVESILLLICWASDAISSTVWFLQGLVCTPRPAALEGVVPGHSYLINLIMACFQNQEQRMQYRMNKEIERQLVKDRRESKRELKLLLLGECVLLGVVSRMQLNVLAPSGAKGLGGVYVCACVCVCVCVCVQGLASLARARSSSR